VSLAQQVAHISQIQEMSKAGHDLASLARLLLQHKSIEGAARRLTPDGAVCGSRDQGTHVSGQ